MGLSSVAHEGPISSPGSQSPLRAPGLSGPGSCLSLCLAFQEPSPCQPHLGLMAVCTIWSLGTAAHHPCPGAPSGPFGTLLSQARPAANLISRAPYPPRRGPGLMQEYMVGQCSETPQQPLLSWLQGGPCGGGGSQGSSRSSPMDLGPSPHP